MPSALHLNPSLKPLAMAISHRYQARLEVKSIQVPQMAKSLHKFGFHGVEVAGVGGFASKAYHASESLHSMAQGR